MMIYKSINCLPVDESPLSYSFPNWLPELRVITRVRMTFPLERQRKK
jgi:hypothetical protein